MTLVGILTTNYLLIVSAQLKVIRMFATFSARNGGYRMLKDLDTSYTTRQQIYGATAVKVVQFRFDFHAPLHCSEQKSNPCQAETAFTIMKEFTRGPINMTWEGWSDAMSQMGTYKLEIYRLHPDPYGRLTEETDDHKVDAIHNITINALDATKFHTYTPPGTGMYSVLLRAADNANNSKIARRFVLFDESSEIELTNATTGGDLYSSSAVAETGYKWQNMANGKTQHIAINWEGHFVNRIHEEGKFLNEILEYPPQFEALQADGVLNSKKFVYPGLDDNEGQRTQQAINNIHGIVRFEVAKVFTLDTEMPSSNEFHDTNSIDESYSFTSTLGDGSKVRVWVRAYDEIGNNATDYTDIHFDKSDPIVNNPALTRNQENGTYTYTSRIKFTAVDKDSGVHKIGVKIKLQDSMEIKHQQYYPGNNRSIPCNESTDCRCNALGQCFIAEQQLDLDNCWFIVDKDDLETENATVEITVYNQAMRTRKFSFTVDKLYELKGLEEYSGPTNIRVEDRQSNGVRITWDLPETASCYGRTDIYIIVYYGNTQHVYRVHREETSFDIIGLNADTEYSISMGLMYGEQKVGAEAFQFKTAEEESSVSGGAVAGIVVSILVIIGLLVAIFVVQLRRGKLERVRKSVRALTVRRRKAPSAGATNNAYVDSSRASDIYLYGGMDFGQGKSWQFSRDDVTFESLLKSGHFANIYKATLNKGRRSNETVVAKTLKDGFSGEDMMLMKAKINFTGTEVGEHANILKFVGAVVDDDTIGPFILYEFCEKGPLRDYLQSQKGSVTVALEDDLFRFGLGIAKGMEYLASKKIVHRRLAARNILLTSQNEVKIYGFGPQPTEGTESGLGDQDGDTGKLERIPVKWMSLECIKSTAKATIQSDVWSFGVVLWEIFSLGDTPYANIRSRDLEAKLKKGERLGKPELCDDVWYGVMKRCWNNSPDKRPQIKEIREELEKMFVSAPGEDYYYYQH